MTTWLLLLAFGAPATNVCGSADVGQPEKVFVNDGKRWMGRKSAPSELGDSDTLLETWRAGKHVRLQDQAEGDISEVTDMCFDDDGQLARFEHAVNTIWGWSTFEIRDYKNGKRLRRSITFKRGKRVVRDVEDAHSFPQVTKPRIYLNTEQLPVRLD